MNTRKLEEKNYLKLNVARAQLLETLDSGGVVLKTFSPIESLESISSADMERFSRQRNAGVGDEVEGRLRIDIFGNEVVRVRYAEGDSVPENKTPMVVGSFPPPDKCDINTIDSKYIIITTDKIEVSICLEPYSLVVKSDDGTAEVGGIEKNYFNSWNSFSTGICSTLDGKNNIAVENFSLRPNEAIYGFGETFIKLNKVGQTIDINLMDPLGVNTPHSYKNIAFYVST